MSGLRVFVDACVLVPINLCDLLLRMAEADLFYPLWTDEVLGEVERCLTMKFGLSSSKASRRVQLMKEAFPEASVEGYQSLIEAMKCDAKNRHVLAGAVRGGADLLVTANLKDFPQESAAVFDVEVVHPDQLLLDLLDLFGRETLQVLHDTVRSRSRPPATVQDLLIALRGPVPQFASTALEDPAGLGETAFLYVPESSTTVSEEDLFYPDGIDNLMNPRTVAWRWYTAVLGVGQRKDIRGLCHRASDFPNRRQLSKVLEGYGLAEGVEFAIDDPDRVAYMKLVRSNDPLLRAMNSGSQTGMIALTLARLSPEHEWRVFSFGSTYSTPENIFLADDAE
ncbi:PIN domain-containing protein [Brevibacterium sanguinis]|uniref:PIN domain-containing protein n=2 Tax=Brevibacterium TaxID=1696 RepID=A0A366IFW0_9MICO|nr:MULTISPECIES: PIN domain-containing protein [Brevibacterium]RBP62918.1 PIN domain-containing protein [Brevibacterium sanguinis]RBP69537.1 PIN domain-containing protein [Brevibacterium celere]